MNWSFEEVLLLAVVDASFLGLSTNRQKGFSTRIQWVKIKFSSFKIMISLQSHNINFDPTFTGWHERIMVDRNDDQFYSKYFWKTQILSIKIWNKFLWKLILYMYELEMVFISLERIIGSSNYWSIKNKCCRELAQPS